MLDRKQQEEEKVWIKNKSVTVDVCSADVQGLWCYNSQLQLNAIRRVFIVLYERRIKRYETFMYLYANQRGCSVIHTFTLCCYCEWELLVSVLPAITSTNLMLIKAKMYMLKCGFWETS